MILKFLLIEMVIHTIMLEIEINALNTIWDLLLTRPYRDRGKAVTSWNLDGMLNQVALFGTINDPSDIDSCWTIEFALPWKGLIDYTLMSKGGP
jgi:hypothetical protein